MRCIYAKRPCYPYVIEDCSAANGEIPARLLGVYRDRRAVLLWRGQAVFGAFTDVRLPEYGQVNLQ